ncbi:MAG: cation:proton antiporter, partial [Chitinophagaceae bacterium]
ILIAARVFGILFKKIRQPAVIGEVVAGIFLGPSLVGKWLPQLTGIVFPPSSLPNLQFFSQMGIILFMFVIGMELDLKVLKTKVRAAVIISHASIIIPYALGMALAYFLYTEYAPIGIDFLSFSLFLGIAMSITAFPVLARILKERGMTSSNIGTIAIACAAADDLTAWFLLAAVISIVKSGTSISALVTMFMALAYIIFMLKVMKPFLKKISNNNFEHQSISLEMVALMFGIFLLSAYTTEVIGIHALFGAFMAGIIMPSSSNFRKLLIDKVEPVSLGLLLPLFFAFSGLRTQLGLLDTIHAWQVCALLIFIAILGKFGGSMFAARFVGLSWKESITIGALINTRGLMELIILNIGYDLGVLDSEIFTMMVLMALVTTFMTGPVLDYMDRQKPYYRPHTHNV